MISYLPWILGGVIVILLIEIAYQKSRLKSAEKRMDEVMDGYGRAIEGWENEQKDWRIASRSSAAWKAKAKELRRTLDAITRMEKEINNAD